MVSLTNITIKISYTYISYIVEIFFVFLYRNLESKMRSIFSSYVKNILMINTFFFFIAIIDKFSNFTNFNDGHFWGVANRKDKYDKVHSLGIKK